MPLHGNALLQRISLSERERLAPYLEPVALDHRQVLLEAGEPILYVWFPHDAVTSTVVDTAEGTTIEVGLMGFEGMIGLSLLLGVDRSNSTVIVQIPGHGTRMRADHFVTHVMTAGGELHFNLLRYTNAFMAMVAQTAACNSLHSIDERLSRWLLMTHDRVGRDAFPLTHEFIAFMLGVRRPSISIAASTLQQNGYIHYARGIMTIQDRAGLERTTCACYRIVRALQEGVLTSAL